MPPSVLDPAHRDEAAAVLGRAFQHESSSLYVFPDAQRRASAFPLFAAVHIRYALRHGLGALALDVLCRGYGHPTSVILPKRPLM
jgi:hypothetical protein